MEGYSVQQAALDVRLSTCHKLCDGIVGVMAARPASCATRPDGVPDTVRVTRPARTVISAALTRFFLAALGDFVIAHRQSGVTHSGPLSLKGNNFIYNKDALGDALMFATTRMALLIGGAYRRRDFSSFCPETTKMIPAIVTSTVQSGVRPSWRRQILNAAVRHSLLPASSLKSRAQPACVRRSATPVRIQ